MASTALPLILCAALGLAFGWWLDLSNGLSTRIGLKVLKADRSRLPAFAATSGLLYVFLLLAGAVACLLLAHLITGGDLDALWALLAGLAAYLAVTRLSGWGRSAD
ncbi:MAG TPA: hypothetical protein VGA98_01090 [Allosphingosinicella sp.]|jgi:hypothetical protein